MRVLIYSITEMAREKVMVHLLVMPNGDMSMFPPLTALPISIFKHFSRFHFSRSLIMEY